MDEIASLFYYSAYFWYYLTYFCYYSWVPNLFYYLIFDTIQLIFVTIHGPNVLFGTIQGSTVLFQLIFTFIYRTFSKKISVSAKRF